MAVAGIIAAIIIIITSTLFTVSLFMVVDPLG